MADASCHYCGCSLDRLAEAQAKLEASRTRNRGLLVKIECLRSALAAAQTLIAEGVRERKITPEMINDGASVLWAAGDRIEMCPSLAESLAEQVLKCGLAHANPTRPPSV